jgi:hypothetical protein
MADIDTVLSALLQIPGITELQPDLPDFLYGHLSQCILAAVFSLGANATAERNVVNRYSSYARLQPRQRPDRHTYLHPDQQEPLQEFIQRMEDTEMGVFAASIIRNQQPIRPGSQVLKAEAVYYFACALREFNVHYLQDAVALEGDDIFSHTIRGLPGQGSGLSLDYFLMLAGSETLTKADRWVVRFFERVLGRAPKAKEALELLTEASYLLTPQYPHLTPRYIDNQIWVSERTWVERNVRDVTL